MIREEFLEYSTFFFSTLQIYTLGKGTMVHHRKTTATCYQILSNKQRSMQEKLHQTQVAVRNQESLLRDAKDEMDICLEELERMDALLRSELWVTAEEHEVITDYSMFIEAHFCKSRLLLTEIMNKLNHLTHKARIQAEQLKQLDDLLDKLDSQGNSLTPKRYQWLDINRYETAARYIKFN